MGDSKFIDEMVEVLDWNKKCKQPPEKLVFKNMVMRKRREKMQKL